MILVIDNYDSFTYNIVQYLGILNKSVTVWRNDKFELEDIRRLDPEAIVISPGPGHPEEQHPHHSMRSIDQRGI